MLEKTASVARACLLCAAGLSEPEESLRPLVELAQWFAAGGETCSKQTGRLLRPIFTHLNGEHGGKVLLPQGLDNVLQMPVEAGVPFSPAQIEERLNAAAQALPALPQGEAGLAPLLGLLERELANLPAPVSGDDLSLYDLCRLTATVGSCISLVFDGPVSKEQLQQEDCFLLYSADFSGIQKFIYTVQTDGALRALRSHSFFLELLMEHYIDELLDLSGVSRANLLYSGGGHCYVLLPNTPGVVQGLDAWNQRFNAWLMDQFGVRLFLAHGYTPCSGSALLTSSAGGCSQKELFRRVSHQVSVHKLHRFSADRLRQLNSTQAAADGRECKICGQAGNLKDGQRCDWCGLFERISSQLVRQPLFWVGELPKGQRSFPLPTLKGETGLLFSSRPQVDERLARGEIPRRIYSKNQYTGDLPRCSVLHLGDYAYSDSMEELAGQSQGVPRLALCRMDVDNLGQSFVSGFAGQYASLIRTAAFSRRMNLFFKWHINSVLSGAWGQKPPLKVTLIYSGGDDVCLVGAWNEVIEAALRIQAALTEYACGALTISAGIGLFRAKFPIRFAAERTAQLEDAAKSLPDKNAVALFDPAQENCYPWPVFRHEIWEEKVCALERFFGPEDAERGNSMLYHIIALLRNAQASGSKMPLARYAYLLSRLAPTRDAPREKQAAYQDLSKKLYQWGLQGKSRGQLMMAIQLYVYLSRAPDQGGN
ncbi:MAG: type III-A CRISPR-associated protein Cas10/Csm1 [Oscillospiraceae bacterium]|nr:type III-A CRISPR-associated protein Cas10/Csm1 [Oscillospiraceae bacterium]